MNENYFVVSPNPVPPVTSTLLDMGFTYAHVMAAINATKSSGEASAHTINMLVTWMVDHPCIEDESNTNNTNYCDMDDSRELRDDAEYGRLEEASNVGLGMHSIRKYLLRANYNTRMVKFEFFLLNLS